jgi:small neutral amino acid transporter SnatA (MarC family)
LIAGPGVIAATIANSMEYGIFSTSLSLLLAIAVNFLFMLFAKWFNRILQKTHLLGPLIRMTGLVISAVATQMIINGLKAAIK